MQIQGLRGYFSWNPTAFTIGYRPTAIRLGWKPIPSKARVTRDEVSGSIKHKGDSCLVDSTITHIDVTMSKRIIMQGTVFQTATFFLSLTPRLRPGLLSLRSVLSSRQILLCSCLVVLLVCYFVVWLFEHLSKQQNNKTTRQFIDILLQIACQSDRYLRNVSH